jgi:hypothetical protein
MKEDAEFLKNNPKYISRRLNVDEMFSSTVDFFNLKTGFEDTDLVRLSEKNVDELINACHDDPAKILKLTGTYGLAYYAHLPVNKIVPGMNAVRETPYTKGHSISEKACEYLLINNNGEIKDFSYRFGDIGDELYVHFSKLGYLKSIPCSK